MPVHERVNLLGSWTNELNPFMNGWIEPVHERGSSWTGELNPFMNGVIHERVNWTPFMNGLVHERVKTYF